MKIPIVGLFLTVLPFLSGCASVEPPRALEPDADRLGEAHLVMLQNSMVVVGLLPEVGGRVVVLRTPTGKNVLKSNPALWDESRSKRIKPSAFSDFKAYYGQVVWIGPQSQWWAHQDLNAKRRADAATWPPDPWLDYAPYKIEEKQSNHIRMVGPDSPISGVRLEKEIWLDEDGTVRFKATAVNVCDHDVTWDVWTVARMDGMSHVYVPVARDAKPRLQIKETVANTSMPVSLANGFFTFAPELPPAGKVHRITKAFINEPRRGLIMGFKDGAALAIGFEPLPAAAMHPEQANVELYNLTSQPGGEQLLELEHHAAIQTLEPGDSMESVESWKVLDYGGANTPADHIQFINKAFAGLLTNDEE
jgi:hypothetical protein